MKWISTQETIEITLAITQKIKRTAFSFFKKCKKIALNHLLQRGLALTEYEQNLGYHQLLQKHWRKEEGITSKAVSAPLLKQSYFCIYDKTHLRTTNAYWPESSFRIIYRTK